MTNIVIPLHHSGGAMKDNSELRYVMRSLDRHFKDEFSVTIVSKRLPQWMDPQSVRHVPCNKGLKSALKVAAETHPDGFFWWYDDVIMLRDADADELKVTAARGRLQHTNTAWGRSLTQIFNRLKEEGYEARDYSHPHGVYWFDKSMVDEGFDDWPGMAGRFPWESWILSKRKWPYRVGVVKQFYGSGFNADEIKETHALLNFNESGFSPRLREWLGGRFEDPSRFEGSSTERAEMTVSTSETPLRIEVHTIRTGSVWWLDLCAPTLDAWAARYDHKLRVWTESDIDPSYPAGKFCEVDMLREFLAGDSDWMIYADADIYVDPSAPRHPGLDKMSGMVIRRDLSDEAPMLWPGWCRERFDDADAVMAGWTYMNAGSWACDRKAAAELLAVIEEPYYSGIQEQHHWNWWLATAAKKGMTVSPLPKAWNQWPAEKGRGAFYHLLGGRKHRGLLRFQKHGLIPKTPEAAVKFTPAFNFLPYRFAFDKTLWAMDEAHIHLLYLAAKLVPGGVGVEIGSYKGASTSALVEAVNQGWLSQLRIVEPKPTPELREVVGRCKFPGSITFHTQPSWDLKFSAPDFVFIDGNHEWPALADTLRALTWGAKVIVMHDSSPHAQFPRSWGSNLAAEMLKQTKGRTVFEDAVERKGAHTHRGLLVSVQDGIDIESLRQFKIEAEELSKPTLPPLPGKQFVLARHRENVDWSAGLDVIVYDKGEQPLPGSRPLPNVGFEAHSYLHHFAEHYDELAPITICLQAEPFEHIAQNNVEELVRAVEVLDPDRLSFHPFAKKGLWMTSGGKGKGWTIQTDAEKIESVWRSVLGYPPPGLFHFWQGAQFAVSRRQVHRRPREFYVKAAEIVQTKIDAMILETMWGHIFS